MPTRPTRAGRQRAPAAPRRRGTASRGPRPRAGPGRPGPGRRGAWPRPGASRAAAVPAWWRCRAPRAAAGRACDAAWGPRSRTRGRRRPSPPPRCSRVQLERGDVRREPRQEVVPAVLVLAVLLLEDGRFPAHLAEAALRQPEQRAVARGGQVEGDQQGVPLLRHLTGGV